MLVVEREHPISFVASSWHYAMELQAFNDRMEREVIGYTFWQFADNWRIVKEGAVCRMVYDVPSVLPIRGAA